MEPLHLFQIIEATGGYLITGNPNFKVRGISTDSRTIFKEDLFIALKGETFDGHSFLEEAFKKGAGGAIISKIDPSLLSILRDKNRVIIKVNDALKALGDIAKIYREKFSISVTAVTGSNGKTTTKEMLAHILSREFKTVKSKASFNNFVGVPLTLLEIQKDTQLVILEMETNIFGGIRRLCEIACPSIGIVTNIGDTHLEYLKTKEGVYREKSELIESLTNDGVVVLNSDDPYAVRMKELAGTARVITFGIEHKVKFSASKIKVKDTSLEFMLNDKHYVKLNTISKCNVYNALAAIAVSHSVFRMSIETVIAALKEFRIPPMRMEVIHCSSESRSMCVCRTGAPGRKDIRIINDSFNSNPQSMKEALFTLKKINTSGRRIAVLGDMLELGEKTFDLHYRTGKLCAACQIDILVTVGNHARYIADGAKGTDILYKIIFTHDNTKKITEILFNILKSGDVVLIKGSRKMEMEKIVYTLLAKFQTGSKDILVGPRAVVRADELKNPRIIKEGTEVYR